MDETAIEQKGLQPMKPELARIAALADKTALSRYLGGTLRADVDVLNSTHLDTDNVLGLWVAQDLDEPTKYTPFLLQGGLGMPDREYYLSSDARMVSIRALYTYHVEAILKLAGDTDAAEDAAKVLALETKIAAGHSSREDTNDVKKGNNHWARKDLEKKAPGLDWHAYLGAAGIETQSDFVMWHPAHVTHLAALVATESLGAWKVYLRFHALDRASPFLPKAFVERHFAFYDKALHGIEQPRERWKNGVDFASNALGEAVGKLYVERYFSPVEKARVTAMVANIVAAFGRRVDALAWMSPTTKAKAKAKLGTLKVGVGYPDTWREYTGLEIKRADAFGNATRAERFELRRNVAKLGKPVDRGEWVMTPQTVNAVNLPVMNALNFPAAILQPPFFDPHRPIAMDYAATGSTIGHEISHSFDDQGALFDDGGKLANWWTDDDRKHFDASGAALAKQFDAYHPFPDASVNGKQTLGENIADLAGLSSAYDAYQLSLEGKPAPGAFGMSGDQLFFLAYAQAWRSKGREAAVRNELLTDGHAPPAFRALTVRNIDAWLAAFDVRPGQKLFLPPEERVRVW